jgi:hypothetical protein
MIDVFCFTSSNLTNIWAGIGASLWAVSEVSPKDMETRKTKSLEMAVGSYGLLYCAANRSFSTPFKVTSEVQWKEIKGVWPEAWWFPFGIKPMGTSKYQLTIKETTALVDVMKGRQSVTDVFFLGGACTFVPSKVPDEDWRLILEELAPDYAETES